MIQSSPDENFLVEVVDGVLVLSFNRPAFGNAIAKENVPHLTALFEAAQADPGIRCILVRGNGKVFSAGGDVAGFSRSLDQDFETRRADFGQRLPALGELVKSVASFDRPLVASVRGAAAGAGLFYPLVADYTLGDETAAFVFAHQRMGLSPDGGITAVLPQAVGQRTARMLLMTAAKVDAPEALRLGILHRLVEADVLEDEAMTIARRFARAPQNPIRLAKKLVNESAGKSLAEVVHDETQAIVSCVGHPDFDEGIRAFLEKRSPVFPSTL